MQRILVTLPLNSFQCDALVDAYLPELLDLMTAEFVSILLIQVMTDIKHSQCMS